MYKKAGLVVGVVIWAVALMLYFGYGLFTNESEKDVSNDIKVDANNDIKVEDNKKVKTEDNNNQKNKVEEIKNNVKGTLLLLDKNSVSGGFVEENVFVVTQKQYVLNNMSDLNMVVPCITLYNDDLGIKLENFFTDSVYNNLNVGDKLKVRYKVLSNNKGVKFYLIISIEKII